MANSVKTMEQWLNSPQVSQKLKDELKALKGEALSDAMEKELEFGTSGLRGLMGAGNNRLNFHTVARASQGLSQYLRECRRTSAVCIAYDTRHMSKRFAECAAMVLCANGFTVHFFAGPMPTPVLSFAIRQLKAGAGIVITASHNPKEYNGYKVYNAYGGQVTGGEATAILEQIRRCDIFDSPRFMDLEEARTRGRLQPIGTALVTDYINAVKSLVQQSASAKEQVRKLRILYTPLYGAAACPVRRILEECGFHVDVVAEQFGADGDFPTTPYPNPEIAAVYDLALRKASSCTDLILATDPDGDRFGSMAKDSSGKFKLLTGNQQSVLICHYLLEQKRAAGQLQGRIYSTNVSTHLLRRLAEAYGVKFEETLTGFKYIGEKAESLSGQGDERLIFAMEESNGCMAGDFLRDKDAAIGALLISQVALECTIQKKTLWDRLEGIYRQWGYYLAKTMSLPMPGAEGYRRQQVILENLRKNWRQCLTALNAVSIQDYLPGIDGLPPANLLKVICGNGSWLAFRPSGTEEKLKVYVEAIGNSRDEAEEELLRMEGIIAGLINQK